MYRHRGNCTNYIGKNCIVWHMPLQKTKKISWILCRIALFPHSHINNLLDLIFLFVHSLASGGEYDTLSLTTSKDLPHLRMLDIDNDSLENLDMLYHAPALEFFEIGETDRIDDGISTIATL